MASRISSSHDNFFIGAPFSADAIRLPLLYPPIFPGMAFQAVFLLPQVRRPVADSAFRYALFGTLVFVDVRGFGIVAFAAVQIAMNPGQGKCRTTVIEIAVAFAAFAGDIFILNRPDDLPIDGLGLERMALPAAYLFMEQEQ